MSLLRQHQQQRCHAYVNQLLERYRGDQLRFGPSFVTTYPFDGTLDEMCYVMQQLHEIRGYVNNNSPHNRRRATPQPLLKVSMANSIQHPSMSLIIGIMHVSRL